MKPIYIEMFGGLSVSTKEDTVSDKDNRARKIWTLIAYLIYHRHRVVLQDELISLLWGEEEQGANPTGALKTMFHRARTMLDKLWDGAGHDLILNQNGGYMWNSEVPMRLDIEEFEKLCEAAEKTSSEESQLLALQLYKGDFLRTMSSEIWVIPIAAYYHNAYIQNLLYRIPLLLEEEKYGAVAELCRVATAAEPYSEEIHGYFMKALLGMGDQKGAVSVYKYFSENLFSSFGIMPNEEVRSLYHEAVKNNNRQSVTIEVIREQLREETFRTGALICEYDFFRVLYQSMARSLARTGMAAHIALLSVEGNRVGDLTERKLQGAMEMLEEQIRISLRRGDTAAKCSASQYIVMLPQANYENSCMVCDRIIRAYYRKHPHSDAFIRFNVYPLEPDSGSFQMTKEEDR